MNFFETFRYMCNCALHIVQLLKIKSVEDIAVLEVVQKISEQTIDIETFKFKSVDSKGLLVHIVGDVEHIEGPAPELMLD